VFKLKIISEMWGRMCKLKEMKKRLEKKGLEKENTNSGAMKVLMNKMTM